MHDILHQKPRISFNTIKSSVVFSSRSMLLCFGYDERTCVLLLFRWSDRQGSCVLLRRQRCLSSTCLPIVSIMLLMCEMWVIYTEATISRARAVGRDKPVTRSLQGLSWRGWFGRESVRHVCCIRSYRF